MRSTWKGSKSRLRVHRRVVVGLVGAMMMTGGAGVYLAFLTPPYGGDEPAHVGYVMSVRGGHLPDVDTPIPDRGRSPELDFAARRGAAAARRGGTFFSPDVYVANNPPFVYLLDIPAAHLTLRAGIPGGRLLGVRLMGVVASSLALVFTYLLGWELSRSQLVGLSAAGIQGALIAIPVISSVASLDGQALAATTAITWALVRVLRRGNPVDVTLLGVACAVGAAVRPMSLAFALAAGVLAVPSLTRRWPPRILIGLLARLAVPTVVLVGWFYILNMVRYGDPTGSNALLEKFSMTSRSRSWWGFLGSKRSVINPLGFMLYDGYKPGFFVTTVWSRLTAYASLTVLAVAISVNHTRFSTHRDPDLDAGAGPAVGGVLVLLCSVPVLLLTTHAAAGGGAHPRYLLPVLPVLCWALAVVVARIYRLLPALAVSVFAGFFLYRLFEFGRDSLDQIGSHPRYPLAVSPVGQPFPGLAVAITVIGAVLTTVCLLRVGAGPSRRPVPTPASTSSDLRRPRPDSSSTMAPSAPSSTCNSAPGSPSATRT